MLADKRFLQNAAVNKDLVSIVKSKPKGSGGQGKGGYLARIMRRSVAPVVAYCVIVYQGAYLSLQIKFGGQGT